MYISFFIICKNSLWSFTKNENEWIIALWVEDDMEDRHTHDSFVNWSFTKYNLKFSTFIQLLHWL